MGLHVLDYQKEARSAIKKFWRQRDGARQKQANRGISDQGERAGVTAGKNMDGFVTLIKKVVLNNGLTDAHIQIGRHALTLPGYFRPTKIWDVIVIHDEQLIAAIELKSQVGPSFGNNFNNRCEEAIGTAADFWTAFREGAFGEAPRPFIGWLMLLEDCERSRKSVKDRSPHFPISPDFQNASYAKRYDILCRKLIRENLYTSASLLLSSRNASSTGKFTEYSTMSGLETFITTFAGHIAATAARSK
ncbi:MAG: PaeR7I family type II restriction endonuclease [Bacteroidia bacterium]|nr:PaeR7I family type II restriction endonuclease [Bacteroidia bacterium]